MEKEHPKTKDPYYKNFTGEMTGTTYRHRSVKVGDEFFVYIRTSTNEIYKVVLNAQILLSMIPCNYKYDKNHYLYSILIENADINAFIDKVAPAIKSVMRYPYVISTRPLLTASDLKEMGFHYPDEVLAIINVVENGERQELLELLAPHMQDYYATKRYGVEILSIDLANYDTSPCVCEMPPAWGRVDWILFVDKIWVPTAKLQSEFIRALGYGCSMNEALALLRDGKLEEYIDRIEDDIEYD